MAYKEKEVTLFKYGTINELNAETLPAGSASASDNFLSLGDRIELARGQIALGDAETAAGHVDGLGTGTDVDGNEYVYKYFGGRVRRYDSGADTWGDVVDFGTPQAEDFLFTMGRTPAGAYLWGSSPNTGLVRINMANPDSYSDFYGVASDVWRGYIKSATNALWMWQVNEFGSVFWRSHLGDDYPYTAVAGEAYGTGAPPQTTFAHTAAHVLLVGRSISITDTVEVFTDDGNGVLTGDAGGTGSVNYTTGVCSITFAVAPTGGQAITMDYTYEVPYTNGLADFGYTSPTRVAGEGLFLAQYGDNSSIQNMHILDGKTYVGHQESWWDVELEPDDTDATNRMFREGTGMPSIRASVATGEGIYYVDDTNENEKVIRRMQFDKQGQKVRPVIISEQLDLSGYDFSDAAMVHYGEYIMTACRSSSDVNHNDTILLYNQRLDLWDEMDAFFRCFTVYNDSLYGGSSINGDVYEIFSGFDDDGSAILGTWTSNDWDMDSEELKKAKKLVVEGDMGTAQELIVEVSYDHGAFESIGTIEGDSEYVDKSAGTSYGSRLYGTGPYGSGESVTAYRYMRQFKINSDKFQTMRVRLRTESYGYLNIRGYIIKDIRDCGRRIPHKFR
jgi:hypothetical protein